MWWRKRVWSLDLLEWSVELPRGIPLLGKLLLQLKSSLYHRNLQMLQLHAWRLSLMGLDLLDSQKVWWSELPEANFTTVYAKCMTHAGMFFVLGALLGGYCLGMPLCNK